jgi:hypothetical protein
VYRRELDEPAEYEFASLCQVAKDALAEFMDAVIIVDPASALSVLRPRARLAA